MDFDLDRFDPSANLVLLTGLAGLLVAALDGIWRWSRTVVTIVHEGGHAVVALLAGRRLTGIKLHADTSGLTLSKGKPTGPGMIFTVAAGYISPSLVGLIGVGLLAADQVTAMLWASVAVLAAMLVMARNFYGVLALLITGGAVVAIALEANPEVQAAFGYTMTWFLLIGGVRPVLELRRQRRRAWNQPTDADHLAHLTGISGSAWVLLFGLATVSALGAGAWMLLT